MNSKQEKDAKFDPLPAILLTVALGIHSFIEGLGIGETPDIAALESAFVAVVFHKGFTAFALAESLISTGFWAKGQRKWFFLSLGIFIFIAIIGIGIGWAASPSSENATAATFVGITSGSFSFVALHELIPEQMDRIEKGKLPLIYPSLSLWAGYGLMSMLALWA
jgi:zinc transporter ZupT